MKSALSLPYMGSKSKSAGKIYSLIKDLNTESRIICDLFCGGFAISSTFLEQGWRVIANDSNKYVVSLIDNILGKNLDERKCIEWVSRELFTKVDRNPDDYPDWYVGYVSTCWSFGNNQQEYMYGRETESLKKAAHNLVVNRSPGEIIALLPALSKKDIEDILKQGDWNTRRLSLGSILKASDPASSKIDLQHLKALNRLQHLEALNRLQHLERLNGLERLELVSKSYEQVDIPDKAVIYCDPPYEHTADYGGYFNHEEFWNWIRYKSKTHKVYVSEYTAPPDFEKVLKFDRRSTLSAVPSAKVSKECVFKLAN
jgi:site-specific DNA-adenine methylase